MGSGFWRQLDADLATSGRRGGAGAVAGLRPVIRDRLEPFLAAARDLKRVAH